MGVYDISAAADNDDSLAIHSVVMTVTTFHAHLIPALFDLFRREAVIHGFEDVETIKVSLELEVSGPNTDRGNFAALEDRIDKMWLGAHCYPTERAKR